MRLVREGSAPLAVLKYMTQDIHSRKNISKMMTGQRLDTTPTFMPSPHHQGCLFCCKRPCRKFCCVRRQDDDVIPCCQDVVKTGRSIVCFKGDIRLTLQLRQLSKHAAILRWDICRTCCSHGCTFAIALICNAVVWAAVPAHNAKTPQYITSQKQT